MAMFSWAVKTLHFIYLFFLMAEEASVPETGVYILCRESGLSSGFREFVSLHTEETNKVKNNQWLWDTAGCFSRPRASFQSKFLIARSPVLLYNSPPEVDAVLHGHKKPIASEVCSFLPFSLWKWLPHTSTRRLARAKKKMMDKEKKKLLWRRV